VPDEQKASQRAILQPQIGRRLTQMTQIFLIWS
jgi:hypothetical protein